jgi:putative transposase
VLAWQFSISLESAFFVDALCVSLQQDKPEIFNSDQGSQFTAKDFTSTLKAAEVRISMDGRSRFFDNIFVE